MKRKFVGFLCIFVILAFLVTSCGNSNKPTNKETKSDTKELDDTDKTDDSVDEDIFYLAKTETKFNSKNPDKTTTYYIYDSEGNREYEISVRTGYDFGNIDYNLCYTEYYKGLPIIELHKQNIYLDSEYQKRLHKKNVHSSSANINKYDTDDILICSDSLSGGGHYEYVYDDKYRLVEETYIAPQNSILSKNNHTKKYDYDEYGRIIKETWYYDSGKITRATYDYNSDDEVIRKGSVHYEYDANGLAIKGEDKSDDSVTTYTYVTDPKDTLKYFDLFTNQFDFTSIESEAKRIEEEHNDYIFDKTLKARINNIYSLSDGDFVKGPLANDVFKEVSGHYEDSYGNCIDFYSPSKMIRHVLGGHEDHDYEEEICGYQKVGSGYYIFVQWDNDKYSYYYSIENGADWLYPNFEDEWEPQDVNFMRSGLQSYTKTNVTSEIGPWYGVALSDGDAYEGGMPEDAYKVVNSEYDGKDCSFFFASPEMIDYIDGSGNIYTLDIYGCEVVDEDLYMYVTSPEGDYQNIIKFCMKNDGSIKAYIGSGTWNTDDIEWITEANRH